MYVTTFNERVVYLWPHYHEALYLCRVQLLNSQLFLNSTQLHFIVPLFTINIEREIAFGRMCFKRATQLHFLVSLFTTNIEREIAFGR
ncbi:hypothetical protein EB077_12995, partial [bacterium]|nr:hypothetical protein [bacterium]